MRHTAHVSNQVVKKPSQNPTKTPILERIGVFFWGEKIRSPTSQTSKIGQQTNQEENFLTNTNPTGEIMGKIMGNHRISTKQPGFFPTNQPNSTKNPSLQLVKLQIFTQARSQFFQLSKFLSPPQRWFGWWWVGRRCCCWLGSNGKAKVGLYLKNAMFVYTTSVEGKELSSLDFFLKKMGLISKISRKKGKVSDQGHIFWGWFRQTSHPSGWKQPRIFFRAATN